MSKAAFLAAFDVEIAKSPWASDATKLQAWKHGMRETLSTSHNVVMIDGPAVLAAWRSIGGKGKPTFKALRALA